MEEEFFGRDGCIAAQAFLAVEVYEEQGEAVELQGQFFAKLPAFFSAVLFATGVGDALRGNDVDEESAEHQVGGACIECLDLLFELGFAGIVGKEQEEAVLKIVLCQDTGTTVLRLFLCLQVQKLCDKHAENDPESVLHGRELGD